MKTEFLSEKESLYYNKLQKALLLIKWLQDRAENFGDEAAKEKCDRFLEFIEN